MRIHLDEFLLKRDMNEVYPFNRGALPAGQASHSVASEEPVASKQPNWMVLDGESQVLRNLEKYI